MQLGGTSVLVTGAAGLAGRLAAGLGEVGATVRRLPDGASIATREEATDAFAAATGDLGSLDAVVHVPGVDPLIHLPLVETDEDAWERGAEAPIREALAVLQAAHASFGGRGGSIVVALPSIALTGAAGLVPFASASEGIRLLVKSAARAWGGDRVRVNCVLLPIEAWSSELPAEHAVPNRYGPSLPGSNTNDDVAGAVALLIGGLASGVTGATIGVDRGTVLAP